MDKVENSDSYLSLLWGTMGAVWCTTILIYLLQMIMQDGRLVWPPTCTILKNQEEVAGKRSPTDAPFHHVCLRMFRELFLFGMARIFPALIILTLWCYHGRNQRQPIASFRAGS
jgi:hypothetical protein